MIPSAFGIFFLVFFFAFLGSQGLEEPCFGPSSADPGGCGSQLKAEIQRWALVGESVP